MILSSRCQAESAHCIYNCGQGWHDWMAQDEVDLVIAAARFRELREAGMGAMLVSVSPFHQESVPLQHTLDGIFAARTVFGPERMIVYQADWLPELARHGLTELAPLTEYEAEFGAGRIAALDGYWDDQWRARGLPRGDWVPKRPAEAFAGDRCREALAYAQYLHLDLDLYGSFVPAFCSGLSLGDWHK